MALLLLAACGEETPAQIPAGEDAPAAPPLPPPPSQSPAPKQPTVPQLFVQIGAGGHLSATYGLYEGTGTLVASGNVEQAESRAAAEVALRVGFLETLGLELLSHEGIPDPVLMIRALPKTAWSQLAPVIQVASEPGIALRQLDLRLPWDQTPKLVQLSSEKAQGAPLKITFAPASEEKTVTIWRVNVGSSDPLELHAAFDEASRKKDVPAIKALRKLTEDLALAWKEPARRVEIALPATPSPSYVNVLTVLRICTEQGFAEVRFITKSE